MRAKAVSLLALGALLLCLMYVSGQVNPPAERDADPVAIVLIIGALTAFDVLPWRRRR